MGRTQKEIDYDRARDALPHRLEKSRNWQRDNQERANEIKREWAKRNHHKKKANDKLKKAVLSGKISRPDRCEKCLSVGPVEGHHPDYSKPLEVVWLCDGCHKEVHKQVRRV